MIKSFSSVNDMCTYIDSKIFGSFLVWDIMVLGTYVQGLRAGDLYLEIGTQFGKSLASAIFQAPEGIRFYTCDVQDNKAVKPPFQVSMSRKDFFSIEKLNDVVKFILDDSVNVAKTWDKGELSMIFIDGNHDYEAVKADINAWFPHLKHGGMMLFHDFDIPTLGVQSAVNELVKNSDRFTDFFYSWDKYQVKSSIAGARKI